MADSKVAADEMPKLSSVYEEVLKIVDRLENNQEPTNAPSVQEYVAAGIKQAETAVQMVNDLQLFSENEELEEISTADLKYLLLPAILAFFTSNVTGSDRQPLITKALHYNKDFLRLCKLYGLTDYEVKTDETTDMRVPPPNSQLYIRSMAGDRQKKIEKLKKKQQTEKELKELRKYIAQEHVDEEVKRKYYLTLIDKWVLTSTEEIDSLQSEADILEHMASLGKDVSTKPAPKPDRPKFKPVILTRTKLEKAVFGAGYPSLPTYTVEEWYDQQVAAGAMPPPGTTPTQDQKSEREIHEEKERDLDQKEDKYDEESRDKARQWDDWKDDHRRGWGNTDNKG